jgi:NADP-dependent 3-hydroxy acid dehydrogenase YdfG
LRSSLIRHGSALQKGVFIRATSGIGAALTDKLIATGTKVIIVSRQQDCLLAFIETYSSEMSSTIIFDIINLASIKAFAYKII